MGVSGRGPGNTDLLSSEDSPQREVGEGGGPSETRLQRVRIEHPFWIGHLHKTSRL